MKMKFLPVHVEKLRRKIIDFFSLSLLCAEVNVHFNSVSTMETFYFIFTTLMIITNWII